MSQVILSQVEIEHLEDLFRTLVDEKTTKNLSVLLHEKVSFNLTKIQQLDFTDFDQIIPSIEDLTIMSGTYVSCNGSLRLGILFYYSEADGKKISTKMLQKYNLDEDVILERSCLVELGNILASSFFNTINDSVGTEIISSVPGYALDNLRSMIEYPAMEVGQTMSKLVIASGELSSNVSNMKIGMIIFQEPPTSKRILSITSNHRH